MVGHGEKKEYVFSVAMKCLDKFSFDQKYYFMLRFLNKPLHGRTECTTPLKKKQRWLRPNTTVFIFMKGRFFRCLLLLVGFTV